MIDGAGPLRILWSVIIPQSYPVIVAVIIFHVVYAWNDYFGRLVYLSTRMDLQPISVALARQHHARLTPDLIEPALFDSIIPAHLVFPG